MVFMGFSWPPSFNLRAMKVVKFSNQKFNDPMNFVHGPGHENSTMIFLIFFFMVFSWPQSVRLRTMKKVWKLNTFLIKISWTMIKCPNSREIHGSGLWISHYCFHGFFMALPGIHMSHEKPHENSWLMKIDCIREFSWHFHGTIPLLFHGSWNVMKMCWKYHENTLNFSLVFHGLLTIARNRGHLSRCQRSTFWEILVLYYKNNPPARSNGLTEMKRSKAANARKTVLRTKYFTSCRSSICSATLVSRREKDVEL